MKKYLLFVFCVAGFASYSQQWAWAKNVTCHVSNRNLLAPDSSGNFYLGVNSGASACIIKFDTQGNELWRKCFIGTIKISGIAVVSNNLYVSGNFENSVIVYSDTLSSAGMNDIFIIRLTPNGNFVWVKTMGGTEDDLGNGLTADKTGNIFLTGKYSGTATFGSQNLTCLCTSNIFIAKYDSSGNINVLKSGGCMWSSSSFSSGYKITVDENGNIFILGQYTYFVLDTFQISGGGGPYGAWFICKLDSTGNVSWVQKVLNYTVLDLFNIVNDSDGNVLITGYYHWTLGGRTVTIKYDSNDGQVLWDKNSGGNCTGSQGKSEGIATDGNSSYIFGRVGWGGYNCTSSFGGLLIIKYDSAGGQLLYDTIRTNSSPFAFDIIRDSNGDFIVCGLMQQGSLILGNDTLYVSSNTKLFIAKFADNSNTAVNEFIYSEGINIFPNPSSGKFTIQSTEKISSIEIINLLGEKIYSITVNSKQETVNLSSHPKGIYFVQVLSEGQSTVRKIVLN